MAPQVQKPGQPGRCGVGTACVWAAIQPSPLRLDRAYPGAESAAEAVGMQDCGALAPMPAPCICPTPLQPTAGGHLRIVSI